MIIVEFTDYKIVIMESSNIENNNYFFCRKVSMLEIG